MAEIEKSVIVEYSAEQMFALVDNVADYPKFLLGVEGHPSLFKMMFVRMLRLILIIIKFSIVLLLKISVTPSIPLPPIKKIKML